MGNDRRDFFPSGDRKEIVAAFFARLPSACITRHESYVLKEGYKDLRSDLAAVTEERDRLKGVAQMAYDYSAFVRRAVLPREGRALPTSRTLYEASSAALKPQEDES